MGHEHFWTSGTDQAEEGKFFWMSTGKPVTYENWNAGEPNNFQWVKHFVSHSDQGLRPWSSDLIWLIKGCPWLDKLAFMVNERDKRSILTWQIFSNSGMRTGSRNIVWSCGTETARVSGGTTLPARLRPSSCARCEGWSQDWRWWHLQATNINKLKWPLSDKLI